MIPQNSAFGSQSKALTASDNSLKLERYFEQLHRTFNQVREHTGDCLQDRVFQLGDHSVRLRFANESLEEVLTPALAHLPSGQFKHGLDVLCWEGTAPEAQLPELPWPWPEQWQQGSIFHPIGSKHFQVSVFPDSVAISIIRTDTGQAAFWVRDANELHTHHHGSPLLKVFSAWAWTSGLMFVHAGCVGTENGAVLLVGKGGSGKSTTSMLCAEAGLHYLSDDYCLVQSTSRPTAISLYNSGKLHRDQFSLFPRLAAHAIDPCADQYEKPVIFMQEIPGMSVKTSLPLRAIVVPTITGRPETSFEPSTPAQALLSLAPSSLFQVQQTNSGAFKDLATLVRALPCYRLNLGTRFEEIPQTIQALLKNIS